MGARGTSRLTAWLVLVGVRVFVVNLVVQAPFIGVGWVEFDGWSYHEPVEDFGPTLAVLVNLHPAFLTVLALALLTIVPSGRRIARQCLLAPSSIVV